MDFAFSSLAYADAIHDFGTFAVRFKKEIVSGLPGYVAEWDTIMDITRIE